MTILLPTFADAEYVALLVLDALTYNSAPVPTATTAPPNFTTPMVLVRRIGGEDDGFTDFPRIQVDVFGPDRGASFTIAEQARQLLLSAERTQWPLEDGRTALIDHVLTSSPFEEVADDNQDLRHLVGTYDISMRRPRSS